MQYRLEGEPQRIDRKETMKMGDWEIVREDPISGIKSEWEIRGDKSYAQRTDVLPDGRKRIIDDFIEGTTRHDIHISTGDVSLVHALYQDRMEFNIYVFDQTPDGDNIFFHTTHSQAGWFTGIDLMTMGMPKTGKGIELAPHEEQQAYYSVRPFGENLRELAQMMRLRQSRSARDLNILEMEGISEFNVGLMKLSANVIFAMLSEDKKAKVTESIERSKELSRERINDTLGDSYTDQEKADILSWVAVYAASAATGNLDEPLTDEAINDMLEKSVISYIIDHHDQTLSADNLHLVIDYSPDTTGEDCFNYRVLGQSAVLISEDKRNIGEPFTYDDYRFTIESGVDNQFRFVIRKIINPSRVIKVFEFPKYIPPEDLEKFAEIGGTKEAQGWEDAILLIPARYSQTID